jgi:hypothetical protein
VPPIIFLDIDGVMIAYPEDELTKPVFTPRCVEAFRMIVRAVPAAKVVFSTTWRRPPHVNRLHEQWLLHGFPPSLAIGGTPDLRGDPTVSRPHRRGLEILAWLKANPGATRWVVLDDDRPAIEPTLELHRCVFTHPERGLTSNDAMRALEILMMEPPAPRHPDPAPLPPRGQMFDAVHDGKHPEVLRQEPPRIVQFHPNATAPNPPDPSCGELRLVLPLLGHSVSVPEFDDVSTQHQQQFRPSARAR